MCLYGFRISNDSRQRTVAIHRSMGCGGRTVTSDLQDVINNGTADDLSHQESLSLNRSLL